MDKGMQAVLPVSLVISTFEEGRRLAMTVESVLAESSVPSEVLIVDDGSTDSSWTRSWPSSVRIQRQQHHGIASARNRGALAATQPLLVFLDAHCVVEQDWLTPLVGVLRESPTALVGPAVRDAREPTYKGCGARIVDVRFTYQWQPVEQACAQEVGLVPGGCLAVHRDLFVKAGGFAPFRGFGAEDVELSLRWWRAGRPLLGVSASVITHHFRTAPGYTPDEQAWLENILRTALLHLPGPALRACVLACSAYLFFPGAIATVLSEPWITTHRRLSADEKRAIDRYLDRWAPGVFPK
jgi:GT2 family glycosyltransferase